MEEKGGRTGADVSVRIWLRALAVLRPGAASFVRSSDEGPRASVEEENAALTQAPLALKTMSRGARHAAVWGARLAGLLAAGSTSMLHVVARRFFFRRRLR